MGVEIGKVPLERAEQRVNEPLSGVGLAELRVARLSLNDAFFELEDRVPERRVVHLLPSPALRAAVVTCPVVGPVVMTEANYIALGFSWTLDCEKVLAGGVSR